MFFFVAFLLSLVASSCLLLFRTYSYDGNGPAGFWWASREYLLSFKLTPSIAKTKLKNIIGITGGDKPNAQGLKIPDENNSAKPLRRYGGETIVITLPVC